MGAGAERAVAVPCGKNRIERDRAAGRAWSTPRKAVADLYPQKWGRPAAEGHGGRPG